jgi:hypothetical protein
MFPIILMMLATATSLAESKAVNVCEDILAKENIDKDQMARSHSLYLEPLRLFFTPITHSYTKLET